MGIETAWLNQHQPPAIPFHVAWFFPRGQLDNGISNPTLHKATIISDAVPCFYIFTTTIPDQSPLQGKHNLVQLKSKGMIHLTASHPAFVWTTYQLNKSMAQKDWDTFFPNKSQSSCVESTAHSADSDWGLRIGARFLWLLAFVAGRAMTAAAAEEGRGMASPSTNVHQLKCYQQRDGWEHSQVDQVLLWMIDVPTFPTASPKNTHKEFC